jgi:hypothetical protein
MTMGKLTGTLYIKKPANKIWCSTTGCEQLVTSACTFQLGGKKTGQTCGLALCAGCDQRGLCPSHRRLVDKRAAL